MNLVGGGGGGSVQFAAGIWWCTRLALSHFFLFPTHCTEGTLGPMWVMYVDLSASPPNIFLRSTRFYPQNSVPAPFPSRGLKTGCFIQILLYIDISHWILIMKEGSGPLGWVFKGQKPRDCSQWLANFAWEHPFKISYFCLIRSGVVREKSL